MPLLRITKLAIAVVLAVVLIACGGGSGGVGGGGGGGGGGGASYSGIFYDAPTQGLSYLATPSGLTGTTDSSGIFRFQPGDSVSFAISTGSGVSIAIGSVNPQTPPNSSTPAIVQVLSLPNGTQVAQILQTLGGTGSTLNVTYNAARLNSSQVATVNAFIASGGTTVAPTLQVALVTAQVAQANAISSLSSLPVQALPDTLQNLISGNVFFYSGTGTGTAGVGGGVTTSIQYNESGILYSKADGTSSRVCVNSAITTPNIQGGSHCQVSAGVESGRQVWSIPQGSVNQVDISTLNSSPAAINHVTIPVLDSRSGAYRGTSTISGVSDVGTWIALQSTFAPSMLASKETVTSGHTQCANGLAYVAYDVSGTSFSMSCLFPNSLGSFGPQLTGTVATTSIPGVLAVVISGKTFYVGLAVGGTLDNGTIIRVTQGLTTCGTGNGFNLADCGTTQVASITRPPSPLPGASSAPIAPTSYPLQQAIQYAFSQGLQQTLGVTGTAVSGSSTYPVTGSLTFTMGTSTNVMFNDIAAFRVPQTIIGTLTVNGSTAPLNQTTDLYWNASYQPIGSNAGGSYCLVTTPIVYPSSAIAGMTGDLGAKTCYTDSTRTTVVNTQVVSYVTTANSNGNLNYQEIVKTYNTLNQLVGTGSTSFQISPSGTPSLVGFATNGVANGITLSITAQ